MIYFSEVKKSRPVKQFRSVAKQGRIQKGRLRAKTGGEKDL